MTTTSLNNPTEKKIGSVVTFYSFKGGVGRSMGLANIAVLLARTGKKVLCLDWDLEAPGLDRYFSAVPFSKPNQIPTLSTAKTSGGLLDILQNSTQDKIAVWQDYLRVRESADGSVKLDFIGSGDHKEDYSSRLAEFSWARFFAEQNGGAIIEALRNQWKAAYDYILVDSRTGLTDASGVCTIQMPDILVLVFAANQQNVDWCKRVADGIRKGRRSLPYDRAFLPIVPVLARFDGSEESDRAAAAKDRIATQFSPYISDWLPRAISPREMLNWSLLPYVPRYSFEEALAVEDEPSSGALGLSFYYDLLAKLISSRFQNVRAILAEAGVPGAALTALLPAVTELRNELRRDTSAVAKYRQSIKERAEEMPQEAVDALETLAQLVRPAEAEILLADAIALLQNPVLAQSEEVPRLMGLRADALATSGRNPEAELLYKEAIELAQNQFGSNDIHTAQAQLAFARFLKQQDRQKESVQFYSQAKNVYQDNSDTLTLRGILEELRELFDELGSWQQMLSVAQQVWEMVAADSTTDSSVRTYALNSYATALRLCGQYSEAVEAFQQTLKLIEETADDLNIGVVLNNLALALGDAGRYAEAEPLFRRDLSITEKTLGSEHPSIATTCNNLALVLRDMGRYDEAEPLFRRSLSIREKSLGSEHQDVASACGNLANMLRDTKRYTEAEPLYRRALTIYEKTLGLEHPYVGLSLANLAQCLSEAGNLTSETESLWQRGLAHREKNYGVTHDRYGNAIWHYAEHLERCGDIVKAKATFTQALAILEQALGTEHPRTLLARQTAQRINS